MSSSISPKLELKYCERCGGLWFRPQGGQAVYCARCVEAIKELPPVKPRRPLDAAANLVVGGGCA